MINRYHILYQYHYKFESYIPCLIESNIKPRTWDISHNYTSGILMYNSLYWISSSDATHFSNILLKQDV